ncbi:MAG: LemA family protein, partial [Novosphingobium sp.]
MAQRLGQLVLGVLELLEGRGIRKVLGPHVDRGGRRADLIPALVETTKGAAASETTILINVTNARAAATSINVRTEDLS